MNDLKQLVGVNLPKRENHDWHNAHWDNCVCGKWARLADGVCADCHDAEYEAQREAAYQMRIQQLMRENAELQAQLSDA